ncbi:MAG: ATP-grasp domain-containing protein [Planctomycetota bacterium]
MRVFVGEYVCGGGFAEQSSEQLPLSMRREGEAMLRAIVEDLSEFSETVVMLEDRFELSFDYSKVLSFDPEKPLWSQWVDGARGCDSAVIIAPETDGLLAKGVAALRSSGVDVIAGSGDFLRVASDKLLTAQLLHQAGVAHPAYFAIEDQRMAAEVAASGRFVVKPRDGCGTQKINLFDDFDAALSTMDENSLMQAWVPGQSISISLLASGTNQTFLPAVSQEIVSDDFAYLGGCGPLNDTAQRRATALASRAINAMPPTARGFVGLDMILADEPSNDCVIEINPRLATSYVGLRQMIHGNLAARLFDIETGPVRCKATVDSVRWTPDGEVTCDAPAIAQ